MSQIAVVTGITGFLAAHVALIFLQNGWTVRGTLRSDSKRADVLAIPEYKQYIDSGKLELHVTGPLESGDYTQAVKGATAVIHVASPVAFGDQEFRETHLKPAVEGTSGILLAAAKEPSVKAVVQTSTFGAIGTFKEMPTKEIGKVYTDKDWNPWTVEDMDKLVAAQDKNKHTFPDGYLFYMAGKKYAELEAWKIQKESGAKWSLATMNCTMIWGPPIHPLNSLSHGGMSTEFVWKILNDGKDAAIMPNHYPAYVDVRDAAEAHYQAAVRGAQGRFPLAAEPFTYQEMADLARDWYPDRAERIPVGQPGQYDDKHPGVYRVDSTKAKEELGLKFRPKKETFKDAMDRLLELEKQGLN